jgi:hypothetical protein
MALRFMIYLPQQWVSNGQLQHGQLQHGLCATQRM